jgi:hypothetical protein
MAIPDDAHTSSRAVDVSVHAVARVAVVRVAVVRVAVVLALAALGACKTSGSGRQAASEDKGPPVPANAGALPANAGALPANAGALPGPPGPGEAPPSAPAQAAPPGGGVPCGRKTCPVGEICCNASCEICTPPDGFCIQQVCESPPEAPAEAPAAGAAGVCARDEDCRLFSDYCTGCDCRPLARGQEDPVCAGPGVRCVADPCARKAAACVQGRCVARTKR